MAKHLQRHCLTVPLSTLLRHPLTASSLRPTTTRSIATAAASSNRKEKKEEKQKKYKVNKKTAEAVAVRREKEKRRTRSDKEYDIISNFNNNNNIFNDEHVPVMLGEVVDVFASLSLRSFVDCTLGAAGHSSAIIESHPELRHYVGLDVDPVAHVKARAHIDELLQSRAELKAETLVKNFRGLKSVLAEVDESLLHCGVDAIIMDLGMSSMQASLKAEDILNSWSDTEVGRVLREYGEESNWHLLQKKIVQARVLGGLHSTSELRDLIQRVTGGARGGRKGWIKTATRVFQGLRIAVNDELTTLEKSLHHCFDCLAPGGRLAVISFHSLEDRIVKQAFLNIIETDRVEGNENDGDRVTADLRKITNEMDVKETWIRQIVRGHNGTILTKRPITPSEEEEQLNSRCRSAKLRVIEKVR